MKLLNYLVEGLEKGIITTADLEGIALTAGFHKAVIHRFLKRQLVQKLKEAANE